MKRVHSNIQEVKCFRYEGDTVIMAFEQRRKDRPYMSLFMPLTLSAANPQRNDWIWFNHHVKELNEICEQLDKDLKEMSNA